MTEHPNTSPDEFRADELRQVPLPEGQPPVSGAVPAASVSTSMPVALAARRRAWTVVLIVLMGIVTVLAFGALIWQALQPR